MAFQLPFRGAQHGDVGVCFEVGDQDRLRSTQARSDARGHKISYTITGDNQFVTDLSNVESLSKSVQGSSPSGPETIELATTHLDVTTAYSGTNGST